MSKKKFTVIFLGIIFIFVCLIYINTKTGKKESSTYTEQTEDELIQEVCRAVKNLDLQIIRYPMEISPEENKLYKEIYLEMIKNERTVTLKNGEKVYYMHLHGVGNPLGNIYYHDYYYDDLDGDKKPELAVEAGDLYIFDYDVKKDEIYIIYQGYAMYDRIMGVGFIWHHDGLHAGVIRDYFEVLGEDGNWERILSLEEGVNEPFFYNVTIPGKETVDVGRENWLEITYNVFQKMRTLPLSSKTLEEIFGDLLEK